VERDPLVETVDVVVGVLLHQQKFLVERRRLDEPIDPGIVCLPGGHVQRGESHADALIREMKEELDITVKDFTLICMNSHVASNGERRRGWTQLGSRSTHHPTGTGARRLQKPRTNTNARSCATTKLGG
jgi:8-oxo-dGTP pyrophosphatase MutT (NUDIX family)